MIDDMFIEIWDDTLCTLYISAYLAWALQMADTQYIFNNEKQGNKILLLNNNIHVSSIIDLKCKIQLQVYICQIVIWYLSM